MVRTQYIALTLAIFALFLLCNKALAQNSPTPIECGAIVEAELTADSSPHDYKLMIDFGTTLNLTIQPIGNTFNPAVFLFDNSGSEITRQNNAKAGAAEEFLNYQMSSSNPTLRIYGAIPDYTGMPNWGLESFPNDYVGKNFGAYKVLLGCVLRDGTVINPGDLPTPTPNAPTISNVPSFSGNGFPGLAPVDFSSIAKIPMIAGSPMAGAITPTGGETIGFTFDGSAGDKVDLSFSRIAPGNLNLGLVVLSPDNKVVFQASLVTSESLTTRFTLPTAGTYTIGVFRIDLLPPDSPQPTAFQVLATLNP